MKKFIPSFEEALLITQKNECFTHRTRIVYSKGEAFEVDMFDYLLAQPKDFARPIEGSELTAYELRGLCFTTNPDGFKRRWLMLDKFFNVNQTDDWACHLLEKKEIKCIHDKLDGSVMRFIELPNGEVVIKSKTFFDNDQTNMGMQVYNQDPKLQAFVKETIDAGIAAVFELTSSFNKIVLSYPCTELTLLRLRNEATGEYYSLNHPLVEKYGIKTAQDETKDHLSLAALMELRESVVNKEGWIVEFTDGQMAKVKTTWYCDLHGLYDSLSTEHNVMEKILDNEIDDALAELDPNDGRRVKIEELTSQVNHYLITKLHEVQSLKALYQGDRKTWAMEHKSNPVFPFAAKVLDVKGDDSDLILKHLKQRLKTETNTLFAARDFIRDVLKMKLMLDVTSNEG